MKKHEIALAKFNTGCNCAQSVLVGLSNGKINEDILMRLSSAFGGGIAQQGDTCGVITGALMALGLTKGYTGGDVEQKQECYDDAQFFIKEFIKKHGSKQCKELIGFDMSISGEKEQAKEAGVFVQKCPEFVKSAVLIMDEIISEGS